MKSFFFWLPLLIALFAALPAANADPQVVDVWPGKPAGDNAATISREVGPSRPRATSQKWVSCTSIPPAATASASTKMAAPVTAGLGPAPFGWSDPACFGRETQVADR
jgi:hypothetical protein